jgi:hypothetical protein
MDLILIGLGAVPAALITGVVTWLLWHPRWQTEPEPSTEDVLMTMEVDNAGLV